MEEEYIDLTERLAQEETLLLVKKAIEDLEINLGDIDINTDDIEIKLEELKTLVSGLPILLDGLEVNVKNQISGFATEVTLLTIKDYIDGIESLLTDIKANQTNGNAKNLIVDLDGHTVNVQSVNSQISGDEYGIVTNAIIHGKTAQGEWKDVKVTPSGALAVSVGDSALPTGASTSALQISANTKLDTIISNTDKAIKTMFIGDVNINFSEDAVNEYIIKTGPTNKPDKTIQTITMNKITGNTTKIWS